MNDYDLTNQRFGNLLVIKQVPKPDNLKSRGRYWLCRCDCGKEKIIYGKSLRDGKTTSCGCLRQKKAENKYKDKTFGKLTVIEATDKRSADGHIVYKCKCECGKEHYATCNNLLSGHAFSCGCVLSKGENEIEKILKENGIYFKKQVIFEDLLSEKGYPLRFDFGIYEKNKLLYLIEFQGEQHYNYSGSYFDNPEKNDQLKAEYCHLKNIPIIYIPYWKRGKIKLKDLLYKEGI